MNWTYSIDLKCTLSSSYRIIRTISPVFWGWRINRCQLYSITCDKFAKCHMLPNKISKKTTQTRMPFSQRPTYRLPIESQNTYNLTLEWPWPQTSQTKIHWWPGSQISIFHMYDNDLDTQIWPRYCRDVPPYQIWSFYVNSFKSYSPNRHTDTTKTLPLPHTREVKTKNMLRSIQYICKNRTHCVCIVIGLKNEMQLRN